MYIMDELQFDLCTTCTDSFYKSNRKTSRSQKTWLK